MVMNAWNKNCWDIVDTSANISKKSFLIFENFKNDMKLGYMTVEQSSDKIENLRKSSGNSRNLRQM